MKSRFARAAPRHALSTARRHALSDRALRRLLPQALQLEQCLLEPRKIERLLQQDKALLHGFAAAAAKSGGKQHRQARIERADRVSKLDPVHSPRHQDIGENEVDLGTLPEQFQRLARTGSLLHRVTELLQV